MNTRLTMQWGVVAGRQVGGITKRFHKTRTGTDAERAVAKAHSVSLKEARRILRYAQESNARKDADTKAADCLAIESERQRRLMTAEIKDTTANNDRLARVAAYLKSIEG
jgi:plasmid stability protein